MKIRVLGSYGSRLPGFITSCLMLNDNLLLDVGTVTSSLSLAEQDAVTDVLLSHAHLDHMDGLAFLVDNVLTLQRQPLRVWAPAPVLQTLRDHLFNDKVWPDFTRLPTAEAPALLFRALVEGESAEIAGLKIDWARTCHQVYTAGYCLSDREGSVLFSGTPRARSRSGHSGGDVPISRRRLSSPRFPIGCGNAPMPVVT